jgi:hypothetical protein
MSLRINGSAVEFPFWQKECLNNKYIDISNSGRNHIGYLFRINSGQDLAPCLSSNGARASASTLRSSTNISNLLSYLRSSSGLTIEFWLQPNETNSADRTIFSISSSSTSVNSGCNYNLRVSTASIIFIPHNDSIDLTLKLLSPLRS